ncbi:sulfatase-like hydrolase/transferase [Rhodopirellula sp. ICT_H3.1]|uniref:Sulfatase-like hydrolase/transferase n=1 Tax=Aporhodopirellula aestuarii TaxID=2950107 RepID=A0ABT0UBE4_9BACT|nr:sulfatase-like hydrolase/transferase [Aporhodopirellula aestuarii]
MRFTNGYANCQVCSPSRARIHTGKFTARLGVTDWIGAAAGLNRSIGDRLCVPDYVRNLPHSDTTIAEARNAADYRTFFAGRWHLGGEGSVPTEYGYESILAVSIVVRRREVISRRATTRCWKTVPMGSRCHCVWRMKHPSSFVTIKTNRSLRCSRSIPCTGRSSQ